METEMEADETDDAFEDDEEPMPYTVPEIMVELAKLERRLCDLGFGGVWWAQEFHDRESSPDHVALFANMAMTLFFTARQIRKTLAVLYASSDSSEDEERKMIVSLLGENFTRDTLSGYVDFDETPEHGALDA